MSYNQSYNISLFTTEVNLEIFLSVIVYILWKKFQVEKKLNHSERYNSIIRCRVFFELFMGVFEFMKMLTH